MSWVLLIIILVTVLLYALRQKKVIRYKCFLLTIPSSATRRKNFLAHHDPGVPLEIIYGQDTKNVENAKKYQSIIEPAYFKEALRLHYNNKTLRPDMTYFNLGAIGCYMGHMEFYRRCFEQGLRYAVIFEDNVVVTSNTLYDQIQEVIDTMGDDFEMCFFQCHARYPDASRSMRDMERVKWISSTKCYLINVRNMQQYYQYFFPIDNHVDMKHEDIIARGARVYYKDLRSYMYIDRSSSTIGHSRHHKPTYFSRQYPTATTDVLRFGY